MPENDAVRQAREAFQNATASSNASMDALNTLKNQLATRQQNLATFTRDQEACQIELTAASLADPSKTSDRYKTAETRMNNINGIVQGFQNDVNSMQQQVNATEEASIPIKMALADAQQRYVTQLIENAADQAELNAAMGELENARANFAALNIPFPADLQRKLDDAVAALESEIQEEREIEVDEARQAEIDELTEELLRDDAEEAEKEAEREAEAEAARARADMALRLEQLRVQQELAQERVNEAERDVSNAESDLASRRAEQVAADQEFAAAFADLQNAASKETEDRQKLDALTAETPALQNELATAESDVTRLTAEADALKQELDAARIESEKVSVPENVSASESAELTQMVQLKAVLQSNVDKAQEKFNEANTALENAKLKAGDASAKMVQHQNNITDAQTQLNTSQQQLAAAVDINQAAAQKAENAARLVGAAEGQLQLAKNNLEAVKAEKTQIADSALSAQQEAAQRQRELEARQAAQAASTAQGTQIQSNAQGSHPVLEHARDPAFVDLLTKKLGLDPGFDDTFSTKLPNGTKMTLLEKGGVEFDKPASPTNLADYEKGIELVMRQVLMEIPEKDRDPELNALLDKDNLNRDDLMKMTKQYTSRGYDFQLGHDDPYLQNYITNLGGKPVSPSDRAKQQPDTSQQPGQQQTATTQQEKDDQQQRTRGPGGP